MTYTQPNTQHSEQQTADEFYVSAEGMAKKSVDAIYFVWAEADPNILPRLIEPFAKMGLIPDRVHADRDSQGDRPFQVDLRLKNLDNRSALLVEKALRSVIGVTSVICVFE